MNEGLDTVVKLVSTGAAGTAVACMLISAYLLYSVIRERDAKATAEALAALQARLKGVKSFMLFSVVCLALGLAVQVAPPLISPKVRVNFQLDPSDVPSALADLRPHIKAFVEGKSIEFQDTMVPLLASDNNSVTCSYGNLIDRLRDFIHADAIQQGHSSPDAGY